MIKDIEAKKTTKDKILDPLFAYSAALKFII